MPPPGEGMLAEAVAAVMSTVPGVARLSGGKAGEVATYLPGQRVSGVRVSGDDVEVHLVARWVASLPQLADDVRAALDPLVAGRSVSVFVEDVEAGPLGSLSTAPAAGGGEIGDGEIAWAKTLI